MLSYFQRKYLRLSVASGRMAACQSLAVATFLQQHVSWRSWLGLYGQRDVVIQNLARKETEEPRVIQGLQLPSLPPGLKAPSERLGSVGLPIWCVPL